MSDQGSKLPYLTKGSISRGVPKCLQYCICKAWCRMSPTTGEDIRLKGHHRNMLKNK